MCQWLMDDFATLRLLIHEEWGAEKDESKFTYTDLHLVPTVNELDVKGMRKLQHHTKSCFPRVL